jgi:hypothetical protein
MSSTTNWNTRRVNSRLLDSSEVLLARLPAGVKDVNAVLTRGVA